MKSFQLTLVLFLIAILGINSLKATPKAMDLKDHFGSEPVANKYGPKPVLGTNLLREGVGPGAGVTPITNFDAMINPTQVVAGDLTNTAHDASRIIDAPLAKPKAEIVTNFTHEALVKTPVHLGNHVEEKTITTMNRMTGAVESKTVTETKPVMGVLNTVREVTTPHSTIVDLTTGKITSNTPPEKTLHGAK
jgi:hypothetical protein